MGSVNHRESRRELHRDAGVDIRILPPADLLAEVEALDAPWIAEDGPMTAEFYRHADGPFGRSLAPRGLAFDKATTVAWDEDEVRVIRDAEPTPGTIARRSTARVRAGRFPGLATVERIDYLERGVLRASRYEPVQPVGGDDHA